MDHYVDINLRPDPEFSEATLMGALYSKLHRGLVAQQSSVIGVSFPLLQERAEFPLGLQMRLHGNKQALSDLLNSNWLAGMADHLLVGVPQPVPAKTQHRVVMRVQVKSSPERLRRRLMRRHNLSEKEAMERIPDASVKSSSLPYVHLRSTSTGQNFRLFIQHCPVQEGSVNGHFNTYGLSQSATVPWFSPFSRTQG